MDPHGGFESDWKHHRIHMATGWQLCGDVRFNSFKTPNIVGRHAHNTHACRSSETNQTCCILYWFRFFSVVLPIRIRWMLQAICRLVNLHLKTHTITEAHVLRWAVHITTGSYRILDDFIMIRRCCIPNVSNAWTCYIYKRCELMPLQLMSEDRRMPYQN